jgi:hypothetical protein
MILIADNTCPQQKKKFFCCGRLIMPMMFLALLFSVLTTVRGQSFYYYVYEISKGNELRKYKTLLTLSPDGSATARVQYNSGPRHQLYLYEMDLRDSSFETQGNPARYLVAPNAVPLLNEDSSGFLVSRYLFEKKTDTTGYYYEPGSVDLLVDGKWLPAKVKTISLRTPAELRRDEPFVSSFYFDTDIFYQQLFDEQPRAAVEARAEKMFLVIVANTEDSSVGVSAKTDLQNVSRLFTNLARDLGITKFSPVYISGSTYSKEAVEFALTRVQREQPSRQDIVIFYYSGHGFRLQEDTSKYPRMSFRTVQNKKNKEVGENIPLQTVFDKITALKPGVALVIGDCCNADIFENPVLGNDMIRPKGGGVLGNFNTAAARKLFFPPATSSIIVGSVKQGHLSVGNPGIGGYFTHFFSTQLEKSLWGYYSNTLGTFQGKSAVSWTGLLANAAKETFAKSIRKQCGKTERDRCIQQAEFSVEQ